VAHMKFVIATALYPPDIAEPAPYVKELAKRLSEKQEVTVVSYGHLPEKVPGVSFVSIDKRNPIFVRLPIFIFKLWRASLGADIIYAENGTSVELPAGLIALISKKKFIVHVGDKKAHTRAKQNSLAKIIENFAFGRAHKIITEIPTERPEILPFESTSQEAIALHKKSWEMHLQILENELL
jgi:hypothetical protein